jgi:hypothetical protein
MMCLPLTLLFPIIKFKKPVLRLAFSIAYSVKESLKESSNKQQTKAMMNNDKFYFTLLRVDSNRLFWNFAIMLFPPKKKPM